MSIVWATPYVYTFRSQHSSLDNSSELAAPPSPVGVDRDVRRVGLEGSVVRVKLAHLVRRTTLNSDHPGALLLQVHHDATLYTRVERCISEG